MNSKLYKLEGHKVPQVMSHKLYLLLLSSSQLQAYYGVQPRYIKKYKNALLQHAKESTKIQKYSPQNIQRYRNTVHRIYKDTGIQSTEYTKIQ